MLSPETQTPVTESATKRVSEPELEHQSKEKNKKKQQTLLLVKLNNYQTFLFKLVVESP